eukprot:GDKK01054222.1.p1 GENE.GDKK01054222.1~~GDKK01054222.1.p1  ORF type:complete len:252 (+),score=53.30 GDKK01054222.1:1-756(+)
MGTQKMYPTSVVIFAILFVCTTVFASIFVMIYIYYQHLRDSAGIKELEENARKIRSKTIPSKSEQENMFNALSTKRDILRKRHNKKIETAFEIATPESKEKQEEMKASQKIKSELETQELNSSDPDEEEDALFTQSQNKLTLSDEAKRIQDEVVSKCELICVALMKASKGERLQPLSDLRDFFQTLESQLGDRGSSKLCVYTTQTLCANVLFKTHVLTLLQNIKKENKMDDELLKINQDLVETIIPFIWST